MNSFRLTICCLFFFNFCFSQVDNDMDILSRDNEEMLRHAELDRIILEVNQQIEESVRSRTDKLNNENNSNTDLSKMMPKDFNPKSEYFFNGSIATPEKPTLESRNYSDEDLDTNVSTNNEDVDYEEYNENNYRKSSIIHKIFNVIYLLIGWFLVGIFINFIFYNGKPDYLVGKSETARLLHIVANVLLVVFIIATIAS